MNEEGRLSTPPTHTDTRSVASEQEGADQAVVLELRGGWVVARVGGEARILERWRDLEPYLEPDSEGTR